MAHFAKINQDNIVEEVIVINNEVLVDSDNIEQESLGVEFCQTLFGGRWLQTSYNNNFRGIFAGKGYAYDPVKDEFFAPVADEIDES